jgi:hypothetical protein
MYMIVGIVWGTRIWFLNHPHFGLGSASGPQWLLVKCIGFLQCESLLWAIHTTWQSFLYSKEYNRERLERTQNGMHRYLVTQSQGWHPIYLLEYLLELNQLVKFTLKEKGTIKIQMPWNRDHWGHLRGYCYPLHAHTQMWILFKGK